MLGDCWDRFAALAVSRRRMKTDGNIGSSGHQLLESREFFVDVEIYCTPNSSLNRLPPVSRLNLTLGSGTMFPYFFKSVCEGQRRQTIQLDRQMSIK